MSDHIAAGGPAAPPAAPSDRITIAIIGTPTPFTHALAKSIRDVANEFHEFHAFHAGKTAGKTAAKPAPEKSPCDVGYAVPPCADQKPAACEDEKPAVAARPNVFQIAYKDEKPACVLAMNFEEAVNKFVDTVRARFRDEDEVPTRAMVRREIKAVIIGGGVL